MIRIMKKKDQEKKTSFVRLTRLDGSPIWLNASFVVTVEPRKGGGTTVVPIGDGLDYDVRENPEDVLAYLDGAPVPEVVPVSTSDALTLTPDDVSPEDSLADGEKDSAVKTAHKSEAHSCVEAEKPEVPAFVPGPGAPAPGELLEGEVARVRKMAPRTVKKLQNTIKTQFRAANVEKAISALVSSGTIVIDGTRVYWRQPVADVKVEDFAAPLAEPPPPPPQAEAAPLPEPPQPTEPPPSAEPPQEEAATPPPQDEPPQKKKPATRTKSAAKAKKGAKKK